MASSRARAFSRAFSTRVAPVSSTSSTSAGRASSSTGAQRCGDDGHDLGRLVRVGGGQDQPQRAATEPLPAAVCGSHAQRGAGLGQHGCLRLEQLGDATLGQRQQLVQLAPG